MDELELFERLRPEDESLDAEERRAIRDRVLAMVQTGGRSGAGGRWPAGAARRWLRNLSDGPFDSRLGSRQRLAVSAAVVIVGLALGGVAWLLAAGRDGELTVASDGDGGAATPPRAAETAEAVEVSGPGRPPRVALDQEGWILDYATESTDPSTGLVLYTGDRGLSGPVARVELADPGSGIEFDDSRPVEVGDLSGTLGGTGDFPFLTWTLPTGQELWLEGWQVDEQEMLDIARSVDVVDDRPVLASPVVGFVEADPVSATAMGHRVTYIYQRDADQLELDAYAGGQFANALRIRGDDRETVTLDGFEAALRDYGNGRYRLNLVRGFWAWEIDGSAFASADEFLETAAHLVSVDGATWEESLPREIVGPSGRAAAIDAILADMPLTAGFDRSALTDRDTTSSRYPLGVEVTQAVTCAWLDQWLDASEAGDEAAAAEAEAALAGSTDWDILIELDQEGGWSQVVWELAASIGQQTDARSDPRARTPEDSASSLGCR
jgi:hypothetical protein